MLKKQKTPADQSSPQKCYLFLHVSIMLYVFRRIAFWVVTMTDHSYTWNPELRHYCVTYILLHKELVKVTVLNRHDIEPIY